MDNENNKKELIEESQNINNDSPVSSLSKKSAELISDLRAAYLARLSLRREQLTRSLKKTHLLRKNRREIARLKTVIHAQASEE